MTSTPRAYAARSIFLAAAILAGWWPGAAQASNVVTIDFNGLRGADGSPFTHYAENGFTVAARLGANWLNGQSFGNPAPFIYFNTSADTLARRRVRVTHHGMPFAFDSVDIYSSITDIPYAFKGFMNGAVVFVARGTAPNTFGGFVTVVNPDASVLVDTVEITVVNPVTVCCENSEGLDNIRLEEGGAN